MHAHIILILLYKLWHSHVVFILYMCVCVYVYCICIYKPLGLRVSTETQTINELVAYTIFTHCVLVFFWFLSCNKFYRTFKKCPR